MKVTWAQHGGLAAAIRRTPASLDAGDLTDEERRILTHLVDAAQKVAPTDAQASSHAPDAQSYTITIFDGPTSTTLRGSDSDMSRPFADLLRWLQSHGKR